MSPKNTTLLLGAHMSIAGGFEKSIERGESVGCTAIQIFTKNNRAYFGKKIEQEAIDTFKQAVKESSIKSIMVHSSYLINIAASNPETERKSVDALVHELERCEQLDIPYLVLHPGSHTGAGEEKGLEKIAKNLDRVLKKVSGDTIILLENMAGQGTNLGYTLEQIRTIYDMSKEHERLGVCLDTCHAFAAGYNIATKEGYEALMSEFEKVIGWRKLKAVHLNDSKMECGAKKDRHQNLGKGKIPLETFKWIMNDPHLKKIPKILETPSGDDISIYAKEIKKLRSFL